MALAGEALAINGYVRSGTIILSQQLLSETEKNFLTYHGLSPNKLILENSLFRINHPC